MTSPSSNLADTIVAAIWSLVLVVLADLAGLERITSEQNDDSVSLVPSSYFLS